MGYFKDLDAASKIKNSIADRYTINKHLFSLETEDYSSDISPEVHYSDPSFAYVGAPDEPVYLQGNEAAAISQSYDTGDLHGNMFDIYFVDPSSRQGLEKIFGNLFLETSNGKQIAEYQKLIDYGLNVAGYDSICVRCSGIDLPGYEVETKAIIHSGRQIQMRTNKVTSPRNGSVAIRLDKNMVLLDLFSYMSGNSINYDLSRLQRIDSFGEDENGAKNYINKSDEAKRHYVSSFCNIWQRWNIDSNEKKSYDVNDLGLCIVVVIRAPKRKLYSKLGSNLLNRLNVEATTVDGDNHRYSKTTPIVPDDEKYPVFIFENVKILGTSEVQLTAGKDVSNPPDINIDFIFRRFRKVFLSPSELENNPIENITSNKSPVYFQPNQYGTPILEAQGKKSNTPGYGYKYPTYIEPLISKKSEK